MEKYRIWDQNIGKIGSPENIGKYRKKWKNWAAWIRRPCIVVRRRRL